MEKPIIDVNVVRSLMNPIFDAFEGIELKDLGDDKKENTALAISIITYVRRHIEEDALNYIPTAVEFVETIQFATKGGEGTIVELPVISDEIIQDYISNISTPISMVALKVKESTTDNQDAYLILALIHFVLFILLSTFNLATARNTVLSVLKSNKNS